MKKILLFIVMLISIVLPVSAKENRLYFTEKDNKLYYEGKLIDNTFMNHTDMTPGSSYVDELAIENGTNTNYKLYFKVVPREQNASADELLDNISMKITIDGKVIYEGKALGLDYNSSGINLQNAVLIGEIASGAKKNMVVNTKLSTDYSNTELSEVSIVDWTFYAQYEKEEEVVPPDVTPDPEPEVEPAPEPIEIIEIPDTMKDEFNLTYVLAVIVVLLGLGIVIYAKKQKA